MLNRPQREAVEAIQGPLLVLAGAGSGKTRVLTHRIAQLIDKGVPAWKILAITFTNKAAREMRARVEKLCGPDAAADSWVLTFHACCARILRRDIEKLGYKRAFSIYDDDDQMSVIKALLKERNLDDKMYPPRAIKGAISDAKNALQTPREWLSSQGDGDMRNRTFCEVFEAYEKRLKASNALDFDDLLVKTLELFADHPPVRQYYQDRFDYVLVDEYQDTNKAQYELMRVIAGEKKNLCVVGDDDQSIYGWRGADVRNILDFEKDFPGAKVVKLEQNYRSTQNILDAANQVIAHNADRKDKALWTDAGEGARIVVYRAMDERDEAAWVCQQMLKLKKAGMAMGQCAVLYRANAQSRVLEEALVRSGLPYRVYGGQKFYDRKEVKDIVAYLRTLVNPDDDAAIRRIINEPRRGIGDTTVDVLAGYARDHEVPLYVAVMDYEKTSLSARAKNAVSGFNGLLETLMALRFDQPPLEFVQSVIELSGCRAQYEKAKSDENTARLQNIEELVGAVAQYVQQNPEGGLEGFLENVALVTDIDGMAENTDILTLMTLHSAKGLEFPAVFITGLEEGIFPITRAIFDSKQLEEERRLMYVGITRAKSRLFLTCAQSRMLFGNRQMGDTSRFLSEIPGRLLDDGNMRRRETAYMPQPQPSRPTQNRPEYGCVHKQTTVFNGNKKTDLGIPGVTKGFVPSPARNLEPAQLFTVGDRVMHRTLGKGTVVGTTGSGRDARITIAFDASGERTFAAAVAPVIKTEG